MTYGTARLAAALMLLAVFNVVFVGMAYAQEAAPEPAPAAEPIVVPEGYLEPLKALENDESAFMDQLWAMGNEEFAQIEILQEKLSLGELPMAELAAITREGQERAQKLQQLAAYGVQRYGHNARARNFNGNVLYDVLGKQVEAVKEWHTAVSLDSKYSDPYNNLGMHYFHVGRYPLGFQNMDKALELDPKSPDFCFNMAQNYLIFRPQTEEFRGWSMKKVYKEAMKLSKKAAKLAPDDYEILEDYAVNFFAAENFGVEADWREAVEAWRAARPHAETPVKVYRTWLNEGRAWRAMKKKDEALHCFREALSLQPDSEVTKRLIRELEAGA